MDAVFLKILNMSIVASFLIMAVIIFRLVFKKAPKWLRCVMWGMVGFRLVFPFSFESRLSLVPNAQKLDITSYSSTSYIGSQATNAVTKTSEASPDILSILGIVWVIGVAAMLIYMLFSYLKVTRTVSESIRLTDNVWICDHILSPFVLGFINPRIYILSSMTESETKYVVAHELAHLKRMDNIWKPLGFVLLCVYWFNPLCWIAYWLFNKDIELACDESVVRKLDAKEKKEYSTALLSCSTDRRLLSACPLAFGEVNVKQRIKNVLSYKKPTLYVIVLSIIACAVIAALFMTNPLNSKEANPSKSNTEATSATVTIATEATTPETTAKPTETEANNNSDNSASTVATTVPEATEAVTEESNGDEGYSEDEEYYYEESYSEDSDYDDSYYEDTYYEEDDEPDNLVPIVPFNESDTYKEQIYQGIHAFDTMSYNVLDSLTDNTNSSPYGNNDFVIIWDPTVNMVGGTTGKFM